MKPKEINKPKLPHKPDCIDLSLSDSDIALILNKQPNPPQFIRDKIRKYRQNVKSGLDPSVTHDGIPQTVTPWGVWQKAKDVKGLYQIKGSLNNGILDAELSYPLLFMSTREAPAAAETARSILTTAIETGEGPSIALSLKARALHRTMAVIQNETLEKFDGTLGELPAPLPIRLMDKSHSTPKIPTTIHIYINLKTLALLVFDRADAEPYHQDAWQVFQQQAADDHNIPSYATGFTGLIAENHLFSPAKATEDPISAIICSLWSIGAADNYKVNLLLDGNYPTLRGAYLSFHLYGEGFQKLLDAENSTDDSSLNMRLNNPCKPSGSPSQIFLQSMS